MFFRFVGKENYRVKKKSDLFTPDAIANSISVEGITFQSNYRKYDVIFKEDCLHWNDEKKVWLLLRKSFPAEREKYINFILPKQPGKINLEETIGIQTKFFETEFHYSICGEIVK